MSKNCQTKHCEFYGDPYCSFCANPMKAEKCREDQKLKDIEWVKGSEICFSCPQYSSILKKIVLKMNSKEGEFDRKEILSINRNHPERQHTKELKKIYSVWYLKEEEDSGYIKLHTKKGDRYKINYQIIEEEIIFSDA